MLFDPANLIRGNFDPCDVLEELKNDVVQVHVKDANKDGMCPLTRGDVDFLSMIEILEGNGYAGNYIVEQEHAQVNRKAAVAKDFDNFLGILNR